MIFGVIGVGAIAKAIVTGLCDGVEQPPTILLSPRNAAIAADLAGRYPSVGICADNQAVAAGASLLILCLRPQDAMVLRDLAFSADHVVVSAMAGVSVDELAALVAPARRIARAIPLPAVAKREGITPIYPPLEPASALFDRLGGAMTLSAESAFDALSASTATVAAHFVYMGTISRWLVSRGIPNEAAESYVASTFAGLASALSGEQDFAQLARDHATPGGINELFLDILNEAGVFADVERGLRRVLERLRSRHAEANQGRPGEI